MPRVGWGATGSSPRPPWRACGVVAAGNKKNLDHFSSCACHPCAGAMLIFWDPSPLRRRLPPPAATTSSPCPTLPPTLGRQRPSLHRHTSCAVAPSRSSDRDPARYTPWPLPLPPIVAVVTHRSWHVASPAAPEHASRPSDCVHATRALRGTPGQVAPAGAMERVAWQVMTGMARQWRVGGEWVHGVGLGGGGWGRPRAPDRVCRAGQVRGVKHKRIWTISRVVRVILAQGPC